MTVMRLQYAVLIASQLVFAAPGLQQQCEASCCCMAHSLVIRQGHHNEGSPEIADWIEVHLALQPDEEWLQTVLLDMEWVHGNLLQPLDLRPLLVHQLRQLVSLRHCVPELTNRFLFSLVDRCPHKIRVAHQSEGLLLTKEIAVYVTVSGDKHLKGLVDNCHGIDIDINGVVAAAIAQHRIGAAGDQCIYDFVDGLGNVLTRFAELDGFSPASGDTDPAAFAALVAQYYDAYNTSPVSQAVQLMKSGAVSFDGRRRPCRLRNQDWSHIRGMPPPKALATVDLISTSDARRQICTDMGEDTVKDPAAAAASWFHEHADHTVVLTDSGSRTLQGRSCLCLSHRNAWRRLLCFLALHDRTVHFMAALVWAHVALCALQLCVVPLLPGPRRRAAAGLFDMAQLACLALYSVEVLCKVAALGAVGFASRLPNAFDAAAVALGWAGSVALGSPALAILRVFRALFPLYRVRALRGLQFITHWLRAVMTLFLTNSLFLFFALLFFILSGMELYGASLSRRCVVNGTAAVPQVPETWCKGDLGGGPWHMGHTCGPGFVCRATPGRAHPYASFDSFPQAATLVVQVMTFYDWSNYLHSLQQAEQADMSFVWFVALIVVTNYIVLNIFTAIVVTVFDVLPSLLAEAGPADAPVASLSAARADAPPGSPGGPPEAAGPPTEPPGVWTRVHAIRGGLYRTLMSRAFDLAMLGLVVVNILLHVVQHRGQPAAYGRALDILNTALVCLFLAEFVLKLLTAPTLYVWWSSGANVLDAVFVVVAAFAIVLEATSTRFQVSDVHKSRSNFFAGGGIGLSVTR